MCIRDRESTARSDYAGIGVMSLSNVGGGQHASTGGMWTYLDSPNTNDPIVYRVNTLVESDASGGGLGYLNHTFYSGNDYGANAWTSSVTAMEIVE